MTTTPYSVGRDAAPVHFEPTPPRADHDIEYLFVAEVDHLVVQTSGPWGSVEQFLAMAHRISAEAEAEKLDRVLWYFDLTNFHPNQLDGYRIAEECVSIFRKFVLAIVRSEAVDSEASLRIDELGDIAHNRGHTGRHFSDPHQARNWLLSVPRYLTHLWDQ
ncbi:hypothetical protein LOC68_17150 [Blastopirellula sp. JC732]|uniref:Uncharacterized protein n=1 Tax=Blastopirellula sediminis TaxID=2894196 RepID=A0A9X1MMX5_9BACT|nr:hypothetical protein [Blastopirellula sediminis]MCC9606579.1 hypothetical protein [Blastopirellula sediminis]MCC9630123.1 hypothetical protein [Blastopirellula sediminis]